MTVTRAWLRLELRRRWRSLLVLALLVAFATATVFASVAGARRGESSVDRLVARTIPATVAVLPNDPRFDWSVVRALPEVESLSTFVTGPYVVEEALPPAWTGAGDRVRDDEQAGAYPPADAEVMRAIERPVVLEGRLADPARADEVVVTPVFAKKHGLRVGDTVTLGLYRPESVDDGVNTRPYELSAGSGAADPPDGPVVRARIVGVIRSPWFHDETGDTEGHLVPSPGLFAHYGANLLGASGESVSRSAMVRLRGGGAAVSSFTADLERASGITDFAIVNLADEVRHADDVAGFEANALLAFAAVAGIAAVVLIGQSVARYATSGTAELQVLRAVGMTSAESGSVAAAGPAFAALVGSGLGVAGAVVASRWFPIGTARLFEPDPGYDVDLPVLLTGALVVPALVAVGRTLPVFLAGFLALLALGAVGYALATATRRRRREVAVLRALGMTGGQSRAVVVTQATALALVGLAAGVPLGVALGRTLWRYVADTTPVFYVPPVAAAALALVVPVVLLAANLLAAWPGQLAARLRVGQILRAE